MQNERKGQGGHQNSSASSGDLLPLFLEHLPCVVFIKDVEGRPLYMNRFMRESLGLPEDWSQHSTESLFPGEIGANMRADDREAFDRGYVAREETVFTADGHPHHYYTQKFVMPSAEAPVLGGIALDVTGRRHVEEALREGERKYRLLFENMTAGFALHEMVYDGQGRAIDYRYIEVNPAFERLTGMRAEDLPGKTAREAAPGFDPRWIELFGRVATTGESMACQDYLASCDRHLDVWAFSPAKGYFATVFVDITERKRAEAALKESETLLRTILDASPLGIACINRQGVIEFWNHTAQRVFGYPLLELGTVDRWFEKAFPEPRYRAECRARWAGALAARFPETGTGALECEVTCRDGSIRTMEVFGALAGDRVMAVFRDITDRRRDAHALHEKSALLESVIHNMRDGLCVVRERGDAPHVEFTVWNDRMTEITGHTREEANRAGWLSGLFPEPFERERVARRVVALRHGRQLDSEEWRIVRPDGQARVVAVSTTPLDPTAGHTPVLVILHDVTEQRRMEAERARFEAQVQQAQKFESLGILAGGVAHDFNNLLMGILGYGDLVLMNLPDAHPQRRNVEAIRQIVMRAADLCAQMLAYSGGSQSEPTRLELTQVIRDMSRMLEVSISKKVSLQYDFAEHLPMIEADPTQIRQVIFNLLTNAAEAMENREGVIVIRTRACLCDRDFLHSLHMGKDLKEGVYVRVDVADSGCGMAVDTVKRIFDPFFTTKFAGRGLGLAAVFGIVRAHGGAVSADSAPGKGTVLSVFLPATPSEEAPSAPPVSAAETAVADKTILLVDDEQMVREIGALTLQRLGFPVLTAEDGHQALDVFDRHRKAIACVVLDLTMPVMNGEECFHRLRALHPDLPIVLCSGLSEQDSAKQLFQQPGVAFIQKPYRIETLQTVLRNLIAP